MKNVNKNKSLLKTLDEELVNNIDKEDIDDDIEKAAGFEIQISAKINEIKLFTKKHTKEIEKDKLSSTSNRSSVIKPNISLPKLVTKRLSGNSIVWHQFSDIFEAAINKNENLSNVQKFTYLQGY